MKKILSLLLASVMLLSMFMTVSAVADEVTVSCVAYSFEVTVKTEQAERIILKIFPLTEESDGSFTRGNVPVYLGQANTPVSTTPINTYKINFSFLNTVLTGWYRAETNKGNKDFYFVNPAQKVTFYKNLKTADSSGIESVIAQGVTDGVVDFDYGNYFSYPSAVKTHINNTVDALDESLPLDLGANPTNVEINTYITAFENEFKPEFLRLLAVAELVTSANSTDFASEVTLRSAELGLDLTYYSNASLAIPVETVYNRFKKLTPADFSTVGIKNMFDTAVLLASVDTVEFSTLTTIIDYYDNNLNSTCINLDRTYSASYEEAQHNQVSIKLKENATSINSASDFETKYLEFTTPSQGGGMPSDPPSPQGPSTPGPAPSAPSGEGSKTEEPEQSGALSDLGDAEWSREAVEVLVEKGILAGKGDGKFYPNDTVTREEFIKIIAEAFDITDKTAKADFSDVSQNRWSYKYIASGYAAGIINGTTETEFDPQGKMTRENMAVIIYRVAQYVGFDLSGDTESFKDDSDAADYAKDAISILAGAGVINGTGDSNFTPKGIVTRAQAAKIVYELLALMGGIK